MPEIRGIHFNALTNVAAESIPELLTKPRQLEAMLSLSEELRGLESTLAERTDADRATQDWTSETAARFHLQTLLENQGNESLAEITSPNRPELIPDMKLESDQSQPLTGTHNVSFVQTSRSLPIFGTRSVVEIDQFTRRLVAVDGVVTDIPDITAIPKIGVPEAIGRLAQQLNSTTDELSINEPPTLCFYPEGDRPETAPTGSPIRWKLAYHFLKVPVKQSIAENGAVDPNLCCGVSAPFDRAPHDFLLDANSGEVLLHYPAYALLDIPVICNGVDVDGAARTFDGIQLNATTFVMTDPLRMMETCDAGFADIATTTVSQNPVTNNSTVFPVSSAAAVTAHSLAAQVFDFFNNVLKRNGIDGKGMKLISIVNCYSSNRNALPSPMWQNAMWSQGRMWYGSTADGQGNPMTTARFLDVMAHELAHGVTSTTASLIYQNQSGALNESFSDIFGILIKNWFPGQPNPIAGWTWTLGDGWRGPGTFLRHIADPALSGSPQPGHMNNYVNTTQDNGGVHINSGIHNRAFFNVISAVDGNGLSIIPAQEVAILYYVTLTKLAPSSGFSDCRRTLLNVATSRYKGLSPNDLNVKLKAITDAYDNVGIT